MLVEEATEPVAPGAQADDRAQQDSLRCGVRSYTSTHQNYTNLATLQGCDPSRRQGGSMQVVSQSRAAVVEPRAPGPLLRKADGLDIVKKASARKGRCLIVFSCQLSMVPGGELVCRSACHSTLCAMHKDLVPRYSCWMSENVS